MKIDRPGRDCEAHRAHLLRISEEIATSHPLDELRVVPTELVLLEVDPYRLHAYWHIEHSALFRARTAAGDPCASLVLRVREWAPATGNGFPLREFPVRGLTDALYLEAPAHGLACFAEIGLKLGDGGVQPVVVSNIAYPPRAEESPDYKMILVDTRDCPESPPADTRCGEEMAGPLRIVSVEPEGGSGGPSSPGASWHGPNS